MAVTVLIIDDHEQFRALAGELLEQAGFEVVGEGCDAAAAVDLSLRLVPDVVLLDIGLPDRDGFEVALALAAQDDPPVVVLISSRDVSTYRTRLAGSPARAFLTKSELSGPRLTELLG
jgi:DNA-binding NarL/FixJ family response regulator